ncbi:hypothetical protein VW29_18675 [Devosia limi DSM 17137]|uniref:Glutathione S-transferase n=1 Tax=Devosia limi DSM 17137 TaxID=1121477 RepID=A0A0F5L588_9HYPH|nr:glutathione S-transferase family protein [Devosia limi]KKB77379.1 hypothetical protein VW29_18675 [Devosia limi DSM 17137]SHE68522.1 Glutathione S-transferase [Devosia limi DSM 17137]
MILYGGALSPFVRRVALWLTLQDRPFERRPVKVLASDFDGITALNPLGRVPVLVTPEGDSLIETSAIIDYLEDTAQPAKRLLPATGPSRRLALQQIGYANGIAEKGVALVYETIRRPTQFHWPDWQQRLSLQVRNGLDALEAQADWPDDSPLCGPTICSVSAYDFIAVAHPGLLGSLPRLAALSSRANALPAFADSYPVMT